VPLATDPDDAAQILDDSPIGSNPYRLGDEFVLYADGVSVKFKATEIVEFDGRRIVYGVPVTPKAELG
jgi:hypothetical protein